METDRDRPHEAIPTILQGAALGEAVKAGVDRTDDLIQGTADKALEALASYRDGGVEEIAEDIVEYVRSQPMTALLIATGVGVFVGMLLVLFRKAEGRQQGFVSQ